MQTFTDLVGTSAVPAHAFDIDELTELTPALDTATAAHDIEEFACSYKTPFTLSN
jgi:hypothetical protein